MRPFLPVSRYGFRWVNPKMSGFGLIPCNARRGYYVPLMAKSSQTWIEQAAKLRNRAASMDAGRDRDALWAQAEQLEAAAEMSELLSVRKPCRPA